MIETVRIGTATFPLGALARELDPSCPEARSVAISSHVRYPVNALRLNGRTIDCVVEIAVVRTRVLARRIRMSGAAHKIRFDEHAKRASRTRVRREAFGLLVFTPLGYRKGT